MRNMRLTLIASIRNNKTKGKTKLQNKDFYTEYESRRFLHDKVCELPTKGLIMN